ncbi:MAG: FAD-dependent oxidoreductase [Phenylobacterium sp.]|uniref:NAD(P)/FAD-dependent oxidoreductase n=1 Tax=Phenylobacterium sp. TaxID=1871053 RepID=UPI00273779FC|nr:FAD-dependent oxidoreductase [Phenylobacterium sp.]MDP3174237.1 FAD-dependent oxidoreductase [Phenylobacterium sp.]
MRDVKYLLIGGGLASIRAAQQIRTVDTDGSILIACDEPAPPYDRPPLSKEYLQGVKTIDEISLGDTEQLAGLKVECALSQEVTAIDPKARTATLAGGEQIRYEKALIATGGRPVKLDLPGSSLAGIHYLRTAADADAIAAAAQPGRKAIIIGGGFIGLEVAATLRKRDVDVTVIEALPRIWERLGNRDLADYVSGYCTAKGVKFRYSTLVSEFRGEDRVDAVITNTGDVLECDLVCIGVGIRPNVELALAAGLEVNDGIIVDENMRTSDPHIYAAGDVTNYFDALFNRRRRAEHWGHAEQSGRVAGLNMAGGAEVYELLAYVWSDIFDIHLEFAGDEHDHDAQVRRGELADNSFMIMYLKEGRVTAFFAINTPAREYSIVRRMIMKKTDLTGREAQLADPAVGLRSLL